MDTDLDFSSQVSGILKSFPFKLGVQRKCIAVVVAAQTCNIKLVTYFEVNYFKLLNNKSI